MSHTALYQHGKIDLTTKRRLDRLKVSDPTEYDKEEKQIKNRLIGEKIELLRHEGVKEQQAIAIAEQYYRMWSTKIGLPVPKYRKSKFRTRRDGRVYRVR